MQYGVGRCLVDHANGTDNGSVMGGCAVSSCVVSNGAVSIFVRRLFYRAQSNIDKKSTLNRARFIAVYILGSQGSLDRILLPNVGLLTSPLRPIDCCCTVFTTTFARIIVVLSPRMSNPFPVHIFIVYKAIRK